MLPLSGPITLRSGQTVRRLRIVGDGGPAIRVEPGATDVCVEYCEISAPAPTDGRSEPWRAVGIAADGGGGITVRNNLIRGVSSGMYAQGCTGPIVFDGNTVWDIRGPVPRGQAFQQDGCTGGGSIQGNTCVARPGDHVEDWFNVHRSGGSAAAPLIIAGNRLWGGNSGTGSAICLGDGGSGGHVIVEYNRMVLVPNVGGIGIAGGAHYIVRHNLIYSNGETAESMTGSCVTVHSGASDILIHGNRGLARSWLWGGKGERGAGYWTDGSCTRLVVDSDNQWQDETLTATEVWGYPLLPPEVPGTGSDIEKLRALVGTMGVAHNATILFADRTSSTTKQAASEKRMAECVGLARLAQKLAEQKASAV